MNANNRRGCLRPPVVTWRHQANKAAQQLNPQVMMLTESIFGTRRAAAGRNLPVPAAYSEFPRLDGLIASQEEILDRDALAAELQAIACCNSDATEIRNAALAVLKDRHLAGMNSIANHSATEFRKSPNASLMAIRSYAYLADGILEAIFNLATGPMAPADEPVGRFAAVAVGGYGRAEMGPYSDIDLLFLTEDLPTQRFADFVEIVLYMLWDIRLKVGHSCRTVKDCIRFGREDLTIRTSLLEHRPIYGDAELANDLHARLRDELFKGTGPQFVEGKLAEREQRNRRKGGNRYVLEPNVKEGKGGLRDLQSLFWIVKYLHGVNDPRKLVDLGVFRPEEFDKFSTAHTFLWAVRCILHQISGRAQDQLNFDVQLEVASRLGYSDRQGRRGVEHFMQDYFRQATAVGELTRIFLTKLEAQHVKREPRIVGLLRSTRLKFGIKIRAEYRIVHGRLHIQDEATFLDDPLNLLRIFEEGLRTGLLIHPDAMRLVAANAHMIDDDFRNGAEAGKIFMDLLLNHGDPARALRRMNELGILGMLIPEFRHVIAMMQFGGYHHFTVDEHTIQCVSTLAQIERGELKEDLPVASGILEKGVNRRVLYAALLMHDVGKGRGEDHSEAGARIARKVAPRLGLDAQECEQVEWLVANHLLMSDTAQKRDLFDPRTVTDFARQVGTRSRLNILTVLTVCDIRGVGPSVWNNWKAQLLRDLFHLTETTLLHGYGSALAAQGSDEAKRMLKSALSKWNSADVEFEIGRHFDPYWTGLTPDAHVAFANLLLDLDNEEIRIDAKLEPERDATRICFAVTDHPGQFARFAGTLALAGANIVEAKTFTSSDGYATAAFWVQDADGHPYERSRLARLKQMIEKAIKGEFDTRKALRKRDQTRDSVPATKRERKFVVPTEISFDNTGSEIYTIVEVDTRDRPGLLYDLAYTFYSSNVTIAGAVIATYGVQAVDAFYVKDIFGLKLHSRSSRESLKQKLIQAIEEGIPLSSS